MRKAFLFVLYFLLACVAAQECAFPLTASGECSGTFSALNFEVADEDILVEVTVTQHSGEGVKLNYALGDLTLDASADGSFVISSPIVSEFAGESPASTRHFILSVLLCIMFLALREKRGALVLVIVLCAVAAPSVLAKEPVKIVVSVPEGSTMVLNFAPGENFIITIADALKGKYALVPCSIVNDGCYKLTTSINCVPGTFVDRSGTFAVCKGCTPVANALSSLLVTCTTSANSRITACAPGYFLSKAGPADVCTLCLNGGANYACATGYKTGTACTGTTSANTQTCAACTAACPAGSFVQTPCGAAADLVCGVCTPVENCADAAVSCTASDNSQCTACKTGYWRDASGLATRCKACMNGAASYSCPAGSWRVAVCTGTTATDVQVCSPCRAACGEGFRESAGCTAAADRQCVACSANCKTCSATDCTECSGGFYYDTPSKTCKACAAPCASDQVQTAVCSSTVPFSNRVCANCPANCATCGPTAATCLTCKPGWAGATCAASCVADMLIPGCAAITCNSPSVGVHRCTGGCTVVPGALGKLLVAGTATTSDTCTTSCLANCAKCTTANSCDLCQTGFYYSTTGAGAGVCKSCSPASCVAGTSYLAKTCSHGSDNLCLTCTVCGAETYASSVCTTTANTVCTPCTACALGIFYQTTRCQIAGDPQTQNRVCAPCKLASSCGPGQYAKDCTTTADLTCTACTVCGAGQYESTACQGKVNRVCTDCTKTCPTGQYLAPAGECTATADRTCTACTSCTPATNNLDGKYETGACQALGNVRTDRVCTDCTKCTTGQYRTRDCQAGSVATVDRVCAVCKSCTALEYEVLVGGPPTPVTTCGGNTDRTCASCGNSCDWAVTSNTYQTQPCTATQAQVCTPCRLCVWDDLSNPVEAPNGYYYPTSATPEKKCRGTDAAPTTPTAQPGYDITQNRICTPCSYGPCGDTKYRLRCQQGGVLTQNADCANCLSNCKICTTGSDCTECIANYYRVYDATTMVVSCVPCKTICTAPTPYLDSSTCNGINDARCLGCSALCATCNGPTANDCQSCVAGNYQLTSPSSCTACTGPCGGSTPFQTVACTTNTNRVCAACNVPNCASCGANKDACQTCSPDYYLFSATECRICTACGAGSYRNGGCDQSAATDSTCTTCTTCTATTTGGDYYTKTCQEGGVTQNAVCAPCTVCTDGKNRETLDCQNFGGVAVPKQDRTCTACTVCTATQYQATACSVASNTVCADCRAACVLGEFEAVPCGPQLSTNRVCTRCLANGASGPITCNTCPSNQCTVCIDRYFLFQTNDCRPCAICGPETYEIPAAGVNAGTPFPVGGTITTLVPGGSYGCEVGPYSPAPGTAGLFYTTGNSGAPFNVAPFLGRSQYDRICVSCTPCSTGTYELKPCTPTANRVCSACNIPDCDSCTGLNTCTLCRSGFFYVADNTVSPVLYRCQACIAACGSGFVETTPCTHDTNRVCTACTQNCLSCSGPGSACTTCAAAYYLNVDRTCTACPVGCASCLPPVLLAAPVCGTCKDRFALAAAGGVCYACPANCQTCASTATSGVNPVCSVCDAGFSLNAGSNTCN